MAEQPMDWHSPEFRSFAKTKIREELYKAGLDPNRSLELENAIFERAQTKTDYLQNISRVILTLQKREANSGVRPAGAATPVSGVGGAAAPAVQLRPGVPPHVLLLESLSRSNVRPSAPVSTAVPPTSVPMVTAAPPAVVTAPPPRMPVPVTTVATTQQQSLQASATVVSGPPSVGSTATMQAQGPASVGVRGGPASVPMPGSVEAAGGSPAIAASPSSHPNVGSNFSDIDEDAYMKKHSELTVYINPLQRMINKIQRVDRGSEVYLAHRQQELIKLKTFLEILQNPSKRVSGVTLDKCKAVLEKMPFGGSKQDASPVAPPVTACPPVTSTSIQPIAVDNSAENVGKQTPPVDHPPDTSVSSVTTGVHRTNSSPVTALTTGTTAAVSSTYACLPLVTAVGKYLAQPQFSHGLQKAIGETISAYERPSARPAFPGIFFPPDRLPPAKRLCTSSGSECLCAALRGEIGRLRERFVVDVSRLGPPDSLSAMLLCKINNPSLPDVPDLSVRIPHSYPEVCPEVVLDTDGYDVSEFLRGVMTKLKSHLLHAGSKYSFTFVMDAWEASIRQTLRAINS